MTRRPVTKSGASVRIGQVVRVFVVLTGVASVLGYLGDALWMFDLLAHFRLQYAVAFVVLAALALLAKRWWTALAAGVLMLSNVIAVAPPYLRDSAPSDAVLTLALANVNSANTEFAAVADFVRGADVVVILEVNPAWEAELRARLAEYPEAFFETRSDNFGVAVFTKIPSLSHEIMTLVPGGPPTIAVELSLRGRKTTVFATHPMPPVSAAATAERDAQLAALATVAKTTTNDVIVIGDLNATPWSSALDPLFDAGLSDTRLGYAATWPTGMWPLRIPIDHCLVSAAFGPAAYHVGPDVGSDHFPLKVALSARH